MATIASLVVDLQADVATLRRDLDRASAANRRYVNRTRRQFQTLSTTLSTLRTGFAAIVAALGARELIRASDTFTSINNSLITSGVSAEGLADAFREVQQVAINTRSGLDQTASLFAVLNRNSQAFGLSQEQALAIVQNINQSLAISGASVAEAAGATRQLVQGLQANALRGEELNSVLEQAPIIIAQLANALDTNIAGLRRLAEAGELTAARVTQALLSNTENVNTVFQATSATFDQTGEISAELRPELCRYLQV